MTAPDLLAEVKAEANWPTSPVSIAFHDAVVTASGHVLLDHITLEIEAGEHVAIVGPSGAGKSTLVSVLLGLSRLSSGTLRLDGQPLTRARLSGLRERTVWIDPAVRLWNSTLLANLEYGNAPSMEGLRGAIADADLEGLLLRLPQGMQSAVGEDGRMLSGGEGQRVRIARAHMRSEPALVIIDEGFRGLDRTQRASQLARARHRWQRATLLCVTHDIERALTFDRVVVIENARIVEDGPPERLSSSGGRFAALLQADKRASDDLWGKSAWRKLRVSGGTVRESNPE